MGKIAFAYSGQAKMKLGAGRELIRTQPVVENFVSRASEVVERDLLALCLKGTEEELNDTSIVHPLLYSVSCGTTAALEWAGVRVDVFTGYSLGAFAAAWASGVFSYEDGVGLVEERSALIALHSAQSGGGAMYLVETDAETVTGICELSQNVSISALNTEELTGISGPEEDVKAAVSLFEAEGIVTTELQVRSISHHPSLEKMKKRFVGTLKGVRFSDLLPQTLMVNDTTGTAIRGFPSTLRSTFGRQLISPVNWLKVVGTLKLEKVDRVLDIGAVPHLSRWIPGVDVIRVNNLDRFERAVKTLASNRVSS